MDALEIFYNELVKEAASGRINCGFIYNVLFATALPNKKYIAGRDDLQIPTLIIRKQDEFNELLKRYVKKAYPFYDINYYDNEHDYIKAILVFLFTNMTAEEFIEPNQYIKKRIEFFDNALSYIPAESFSIGTSSYIGDIEASITKESIYEETPYSLKFKAYNSTFPTVRFGITNDTVYIYAIQNEKNDSIDKKINRILYKINDGLNTMNESYDNIMDYENITGVSASSVVAATLSLSFFLRNGYKDIRMPSFLPIRYNAKIISTEKKLQKYINNPDFDQIQNDLITKNTEIQRNISDKFIRTFRRITYHFDNINIYSYPFDVDSYLHLTMNEGIYCKNNLLNDLFSCGYHSKKTK